jgi:hypothetical protein
MSPFSVSNVRGRPGWYYGLFIRHRPDGGPAYYVFDLYGPGGQRIKNLESSIYRTTTLARRMGDHRLGHEHVAHKAIDGRR